MPTSVIVLSSYDPDYLRIAEHLVRRERSAGVQPVVLDISRVLATPADTFHRTTLTLFGLSYPGRDARARFSSLGAEVVDVLSLPESSRHPDLPGHIIADLEVAIMSALITFYRTDIPRSSIGTVRRSRLALDREGRLVYGAVSFLITSREQVTTVFVPNGRYPNQKMAGLAARELGVSTMHFEKGEGRDAAYLQPYSPQSRLASQASVTPTLATVPREEVERISDEWMSRRAPAHDSRNEFSALWADGLPEAVGALAQDYTRTAGFFTSSQDEFQSLGPEWQLHSWKNQFEAFDAVMTKLELAGFGCFIRVHPNLATKAHEAFVRERRDINWLASRHPNLVVIWHDEPANSYALVKRSDVVVVWDSTIGLEASAQGIPVWTTATSRYGLVADVRELLSSKSVNQSDLTPWAVDAHAAKRFIAYLVLRDSQMGEPGEPWEPWDVKSPPLGARLSRILVSGGNPTPTTAVRSLVDVYRHRSARANLRSLRSR